MTKDPHADHAVPVVVVEAETAERRRQARRMSSGNPLMMIPWARTRSRTGSHGGAMLLAAVARDVDDPPRSLEPLSSNNPAEKARLPEMEVP